MSKQVLVINWEDPGMPRVKNEDEIDEEDLSSLNSGDLDIFRVAGDRFGSPVYQRAVVGPVIDADGEETEALEIASWDQI